MDVQVFPFCSVAVFIFTSGSLVHPYVCRNNPFTFKREYSTSASFHTVSWTHTPSAIQMLCTPLKALKD